MGGYSFDRLYRNSWLDTDPDNFVELTEEQKRKKREDQFMESLPSYMKWDKDIQNVLLGDEGSPSRDIASAVHKGMELSQEGLNKATSFIAGVPEQPYEKTVRGAFEGAELGSAVPGVGEGGISLPEEYGGEGPLPNIPTPRVFGDVAVKGLQMAADPSQLALMAGGPVGMALAPVMVPEMAQAGGEQFGTGMSEAMQESDPERARSLMATGAIDIGMAAAGLKHPLSEAGKAFKGGVLDVPAFGKGTEAGAIGPDINAKPREVGDRLPNGKYVHEMDAEGNVTIVGKEPPVTLERESIPVERLPGPLSPEIEAPPEAITPEPAPIEPIPDIPAEPSIVDQPTPEIEAPPTDAPVPMEPTPAPPIEAPPIAKTAPTPSMEPPDIAERTKELIAEGHEPGRAARIARAEFAESMDEITAAMDQLTPEDVDSLMAAEVAGEGAIPTPPEALRGTTKITKPPPEIPLAEEGIPAAGEEAPVKTFKVKLSNGETYSTKARSVEEAVAKTNEQLEEYGSQVRATEAAYTPSRLERLVEPVSPSREKGMIKSSEAIEKAKTAEELRLAKQERRLQERADKATTPFEVTLDNGEIVTVKGKSIEAVTASIEAKGGKIAKIIPKPSPLDRALAKGAEVPTAETPEAMGRAAITENDNFMQAWGKLSIPERGAELLNIFKALRGSGDLGHILRQGKIMTIDMLMRNPKALLSALDTMRRQTFSEGEFQSIQQGYENSPRIKRFTEEMGLDLPGVGKGVKEEAFQASLAEKIPGVGKYWVRPSDRAYTSFLNAARVYKMNQIVERMEAAGLTFEKNPKAFQDAAKVVNIIGGRGHDLGQWVTNLNYAMWSARFKASNIQLLNEYLKGTTGLGKGEALHPIARKELTRGMNQMIGLNVAILGTLAAAGGEVEKDPTHTDFLKVRIGGKVYDPWKGLQPIVRSVGRTAIGERTSRAGRIEKTGFGREVGEQIFTAPALVAAVEVGLGRTMSGYEKNRLEAAIESVSPMFEYELMKDLVQNGLAPETVGSAVPSLLGEGMSEEKSQPLFEVASKASSGGGDWAETKPRKGKGRRSSEVAW